MFDILPIDYYKRKSLYTWYTEKDEIDFNPEYQRDSEGTWTTKMKQKLIDSIINGFDLPKFYLHLLNKGNMINTSGKKYAVIDGKQRLNCIFEFFEDKFTLNSDIEYFKDNNINIKKFKYSQLVKFHPKIAMKIQEYTIDVIYVVTDETRMIEELFLRLNSGRPLVNSEKRNAYGGFLANQIKELAKSSLFFTKKVSFDNNRKVYNDVILKFLLLEEANGLISLTSNELNSFLEKNRKENEHIKHIIASMKSVLYYMEKVFEDNDVLLSKHSVLPVYYWFIKEHMNSLPENIRNFLMTFTEQKQKSEEPEMYKYRLAERNSVGKKESLQIRINILNKYFLERYS